MTALEQLGTALAQLAPPAETVRARLGVHVLDATGACIAGAATSEGQRLTSLCHPGLAALSEAPLDRVALLAATTRLTEIDDIHLPSCTTPASIVWASACGVARHLPVAVRAEEFALALLAGYEVVTRLGMAIGGPKILYRGIWPTCFVAPVGAAVVTARLLRLGGAQMADALALALTQCAGAPGAPSHSGTSARWLQLGLAVRAGAAAALAAAAGFGCDRSLLDGDFLSRTHGIDCDPAPLCAPMQGDAVMRVSIKPYCAAKQCIAAIEALRELLRSGIAVAQIAAVRVAVPPAYAAMISRREVGSSRLARISSVAYQLALAAYRPELLEDVHRPDLSGDPAVRGFMQRVEVVPEETLTIHYPQHWPARLEVSLQDGRCETRLVREAYGDPERPLGGDAALAKFHHLVGATLAPQRAASIATACLACVRDDAALARLLAQPELPIAGAGGAPANTMEICKGDT